MFQTTNQSIVNRGIIGTYRESKKDRTIFSLRTYKLIPKLHQDYRVYREYIELFWGMYRGYISKTKAITYDQYGHRLDINQFYPHL